MRKIDFTKLKVETLIDVFEEKNIAKEVGNILHVNTSDIGIDDLARKIYHSTEVIEIDDEQYEMIIIMLKKAGLTIPYIKAVENNVL